MSVDLLRLVQQKFFQFVFIRTTKKTVRKLRNKDDEEFIDFLENVVDSDYLVLTENFVLTENT